MRLFLLFFTIALTFACSGPANTVKPNVNVAKPNVSNVNTKQSGVPVYTYEVVKAYPHDPNLAYPWRAWAELVDFAGIDDPMASQVRSRAATAAADEPPIGYRRAPVTIRHEGWALETFLQQFGGDLGPEAIDHRAGGVVGRAKLVTDASSGVEVGVLEGYSAVVGSGAAIKIVFEDPGDWQWALDIWRSLAPG